MQGARKSTEVWVSRRRVGADRVKTTIMRDEIVASSSVAQLLIDDRAQLQAIGNELARRRPAVIVVAGRGTSDHAAIYARYLLEHAVGVPVALAAASLVTLYGIETASPHSALIALSQSGAGPDMIALVESARRNGALTIALTNDAASAISAAAEMTAHLRAGEERAVAATKTYIAELVSVALIAAAAARALDRDATWVDEISDLPARMRASLAAADEWIATARDRSIFGQLVAADRALVVGRGYEFPNALEFALKLRETTGAFADGYSAADLLHGPIASAGPNVPAILLDTDPLTTASLEAARARLIAAGSPTLLLRTSGGGVGELLQLPGGPTGPLATPATAIAGLALIEALATARGRNPDTPAGLTKVTKTL